MVGPEGVAERRNLDALVLTCWVRLSVLLYSTLMIVSKNESIALGTSKSALLVNSAGSENDALWKDRTACRRL